MTANEKKQLMLDMIHAYVRKDRNEKVVLYAKTFAMNEEDRSFMNNLILHMPDQFENCLDVIFQLLCTTHNLDTTIRNLCSDKKYGEYVQSALSNQNIGTIISKAYGVEFKDD